MYIFLIRAFLSDFPKDSAHAHRALKSGYDAWNTLVDPQIMRESLMLFCRDLVSFALVFNRKVSELCFWFNGVMGMVFLCLGLE